MMSCPKTKNTQANHTKNRSLVLGVILGVSLLVSATFAADSPQTAHRYTLSQKIKATVGDDGSLEIHSAAFSGVLLQGQLDSLSDSRRRRGKSEPVKSTIFFVKEGQTGGLRGFSSRADDDGDGRVDEDPLDGLDNDGDKSIDEDFAAISDGMTVVHLSQGNGQAQLEFMQWAAPRLKGALFLNFAATHQLSGVTIPYYQLESKGDAWQEVDVFSRTHDLAGRSHTEGATAFVVRMVNPGAADRQSAPSSLNPIGPDAATWIGVLVLDQSAKVFEKGQLRPKLDGRLLSLPLTDVSRATVVCTASSWLQLNRLLLNAKAVYQGVVDPVSGHQAHWIVSPLCSLCRLEKTVELAVSKDLNGALTLGFTLEPGRSGLLDPDLFILGGKSLGAPSEITWKPAKGQETAVSWELFTPEKLSRLTGTQSDLYGLLGSVRSHQAQGVLEFHFGNPAERGFTNLADGTTQNLEGTWLDGRGFSTQGRMSEFENVDSNMSAENIKAVKSVSGKRPLTLSPHLLEGWPNPFQDQIQIKFVVPSTVQETFDWAPDKPLPEGLELSAPVDWKSGQPNVSVKVYSINGQELVSLQQGTLSEGHYSVTWNGTDSYGRKVASGTYFCKLQLDNWSVTRRLVFLR